MKSLRVTTLAEGDIESLLLNSEAEFGPEMARRYRSLLNEGLVRIMENPDRAGIPYRFSQEPNLRLFHLRLARLRMSAADRIARPRHVLVFRVSETIVILIRVLHDAMDFPRHLADI